MTLKDELYNQDKGITFAENIDRAWAIYSDEKQKEEDRLIAQSFLIYAFNLKSLDKLNEQLLVLMEDRNKHKAKNPEYIPGHSAKHLKLKPEEMVLARTTTTKVTSDPKLKTLFKDGEMLDVNPSDKVNDLSWFNPTRYFTSQERAQYRVHIYQGKFYQKGEVFDTTGYVAHRKQDFAAFTINANGELSIFKHLGMADRVAHSSMNAGSPVVCAGELVIKNGELITINSFSGHYDPSLFNIYRALEFFSDKGINVSKAKVHLFQDPSSTGLKISSSKVSIPSTEAWSTHTFYEIPAAVFFTTVKESLNKSLNSIKADTEKYQSFSFMTLLFNIKDSIIKSTLTHDRKVIAEEVYKTANELLSQLTDNDNENTQKVADLIKQLEELKEKNSDLSSAHGKSRDSGRLHAKIESFLERAHAISDLKNPITSGEEDKMKLVF